MEGADAVLKRMAALPAALTEAAASALEQNAEELVQMMRGLAPKDSGDLARSIGWTWGDAPKGSMVLGTVRGGRGAGKAYGTMQITVFAGGKGPGFDAFYARFQEFGTRKMPANPFFFPAYRANRKRMKSRMTRALKKALKVK